MEEANEDLQVLWVTSSMRSFHSLHCAALRHGQPGLGAVFPTSSRCSFSSACRGLPGYTTQTFITATELGAFTVWKNLCGIRAISRVRVAKFGSVTIVGIDTRGASGEELSGGYQLQRSNCFRPGGGTSAGRSMQDVNIAIMRRFALLSFAPAAAVDERFCDRYAWTVCVRRLLGTGESSCELTLSTSRSHGQHSHAYTSSCIYSSTILQRLRQVGG